MPSKQQKKQIRAQIRAAAKAKGKDKSASGLPSEINWWDNKPSRIDRLDQTTPHVAGPMALSCYGEKGRWSELEKLGILNTLATCGPDILSKHVAQELFLKHTGTSIPKHDHQYLAAWSRIVENKSAEQGIADGVYILRIMKEIILPEVSGEFPLAFVNWFDVINTCLDIVTAVNKHALEIKDYSIIANGLGLTGDPAQSFVYFVDGILGGLEDCSNAAAYGSIIMAPGLKAVVAGIQSVEAFHDQAGHLFKHI
ncbi:hypothetical protein EJ08DRAFT_666689 [Tothia fuscella]|uniref:Uncharacterized protein n=1 Tax=Tothia fuscella TaxID=1048955 RepID=A0A9P4NDY4_9PEZI|nr:hypothetical protein EJ08DRAFT_666689 [Tothia fuscella]